MRYLITYQARARAAREVASPFPLQTMEFDTTGQLYQGYMRELYKERPEDGATEPEMVTDAFDVFFNEFMFADHDMVWHALAVQPMS